MELSLYERERAAGTVLVEQQGEETVFAVRADLEPGLYRVAMRGEGGELLLGVMEGGCGAVLRRRFSPSVVSRVGEMRSAEATRCTAKGGVWHTADEEERRNLPPLPPASLCRRKDGRIEVAIPAPEGQPFPLAERFCLARLCVLEGRRWAVFSFDKQGEMIFPQEI